MLILDATTKSLEVRLAGAVSANQLPVTAYYTDITTTLYTPGSNDTQSNGATAVTIVAAPAASTQRHVESISVYNADTAAATVTIQLNNNSTLRIITKVTLQAAEQLFYEDGMGWQIIDANGAVIRGTNVSDTAYASSWDGITTIAPSKNAVYDQMLLQMLKNGSNLAIGSDADGDMYYRASSALARLAKGAANYKLFMNAGETAPEWAAGIACGSFTRDLGTTSGDGAAVSCGFLPNIVILFSGVHTINNCFGFDNGATRICMMDSVVATALLGFSNSYSMLFFGDNSTKFVSGKITLGVDGFTPTYTRESTPTGTGTCYYIALR